MPRKVSDAKLDLLGSIYQAEYDRWCARCKLSKRGYELVRNSSPKNDINADEYFEVTNLTLREARNYDEAEAWCRTYANRAAMRAVLERL